MKIVFLISSKPSEIYSIRARNLSQNLVSLGNYDITHLQRRNKIIDIFRFFLEAKKIKPDVIYIVNFSYSAIVAGLAMKLFYRTKLFYDTGDVNHELFKTLSQNIIKINLIRLLEQAVQKYSNTILVRGRYHKKYLKDKGFKNVFFLPDGINPKHSKPFTVDTLKKKLGLRNLLVIGTIGTTIWNKKYKMCYGWDIVEALRILKDEPVKVIFIGGGDGLERLKQRARKYSIKNKIIFTGSISYEEVPRYINLMDICISTQTNNLTGWVRTTGKLPEFLACSKFILASNVGEASFILDKSMLLDYNGIKDLNYPQKLARAIKRILKNPKILKRGRGGRSIAKKFYSYQVLARRLHKLLNRD